MLKHVKHALLLSSRVGPWQALRWFIGRPGSICELLVVGVKVNVRRRTPDLLVAIESLGGEFDFSRQLLNRDYDGVIVDAGGYIGTAAIAFSKLFPRAKIVSIEPSKDNLEVLEKNVRNWGNISFMHAALVGEAISKVSLFDPGQSNWGMTVENTHAGITPSSRLYEVAGITLEQIGHPVSEVGLLKLDIEGGELDIFTKSNQLLVSIPVVVAELHDRFVPGCEQGFIQFSKERFLYKGAGEKFWSVDKGTLSSSLQGF